MGNHIQDQEDANIAACVATAAKYGISADRAQECDDGDVGCFDCPFVKRSDAEVVAQKIVASRNRIADIAQWLRDHDASSASVTLPIGGCTVFADGTCDHPLMRNPTARTIGLRRAQTKGEMK